MKEGFKLTDQELIKLYRVALSIAAIAARNNPPSYVPNDMSMEDFLTLYSNGEEDIFGERFIAYWLNQAKKELKWEDNL